MYREIEKVRVTITTANEKENQKYFNLFKLLLETQIIEFKDSSTRKSIETEKFTLNFLVLNQSQRGHKAHFVLNLTQDKELEYMVARSMTSIHSMLKDDDNWTELFNKLG